MQDEWKVAHPEEYLGHGIPSCLLFDGSGKPGPLKKNAYSSKDNDQQEELEGPKRCSNKYNYFNVCDFSLSGRVIEFGLGPWTAIEALGTWPGDALPTNPTLTEATATTNFLMANVIEVRLPIRSSECVAKQSGFIEKEKEDEIRIEAESAKTAEASAENQKKWHEERQPFIDDGNLALVQEYLKEEEEEPLFDIWEGDGKQKMMYQVLPPGWRLADKADVSKDLTQIRAMYKPQQVVWSGRKSKDLGGRNLGSGFGSGFHGLRKTRKHLNGRKAEDYGPAQMADGKAFFDDGSEDVTRHVKPNPEGEEMVKHMLIVRKRVP